MNEVTTKFFAIIGILAVLRILITCFSFIYRHFLRSPKSWTRFRGDWAVITGASSGIGAGFARQLAQKGVNVVLIARSKERLAEVSKQVEKTGSKARCITFDFDTASDVEYNNLKKDLEDLPITILVNNVGMNVSFPTNFVDTPQEKVAQITRVNIESTNRMTAMLLPRLISQRKGIVYCLSSGGGGVCPAPLLAVYAGTKAYNDAFAVALAGEVGSLGVKVHSLTPFFVESGMAKMRPSLMVPTADHFADCALANTGFQIRDNPYWVHELIGVVITSFPLRKQVTQVAKLHRDIRSRALRKQARLASKS